MQHVSPPSSQSSAYECRFPWFKRLDDSKGFCTLCAKYFTQHPTRVVHPFTSPEGTVFLNEDELCQHDRSRVHAKAERDGKPLAIPEVQDDDFPKFSEQHTFKTEKGYNNFKTYFKNNPPRQHEVPTEKQAQDNGYKNVVQAYLHDNIGNFDACDLGEPHSSHCDHRC